MASGWPAAASRTPSTSIPAVMVKKPNTRSGAWMSAATLERKTDQPDHQRRAQHDEPGRRGGQQRP